MSFDIDDGTPCYRYSHKIRKARKDHKCSACRRIIRNGDNYAYVDFADQDSGPGVVKRCGSCELTWQHLAKIGAGVDVSPSFALDCGESYEDHWGTEPPDEVAAFAFMSDDEASAALSRTVKP